ncbi:MAG: palindromic element RPE4 domain-containing protein [Rickettsia endosymbiont of Eriopis connexa]|nr:palindromic element RPE4 domain-containing protein [Rickettsia endosymbiont of Eriopis connexa]
MIICIWEDVIPWLDHGIQLKILIILNYFFLDTVVKPRYDSGVFFYQFTITFTIPLLT